MKTDPNPNGPMDVNIIVMFDCSVSVHYYYYYHHTETLVGKPTLLFNAR